MTTNASEANGAADRYQYRIKANGAESQVLDSCPSDQWAFAAQGIEDRGGVATLERRLITDESIFPMLVTPAGWKRLGAVVVGPWAIIAEVESR